MGEKFCIKAVRVLKIACGTDIIEIERIKKSIEELEDKFLNRIFSEEEIKYCESHKEAKYEHYAARFAVKEATFKAINKVKEEDYLDWKKYKVSNLESGKPQIDIEDEELREKIEDIDISISHCKNYAMATVVIIYN